MVKQPVVFVEESQDHSWPSWLVIFTSSMVTLIIGLYWFALIHDFWWEW